MVDDLSRRDFTINAMAVSLPDRELLDPFGGADDLRARRLRTPLAPAESFGDDPLRMLRAARFLPRFDLDPEPGLEEAAAELAPRLSIVSVERVRDELERLLAVADPARGLAFLLRTGLLGRAVPGLAALDDAGRAGACALAAAPGPPRVRRAGLLAPLGRRPAPPWPICAIPTPRPRPRCGCWGSYPRWWPWRPTGHRPGAPSGRRAEGRRRGTRRCAGWSTGSVWVPWPIWSAWPSTSPVSTSPGRTSPGWTSPGWTSPAGSASAPGQELPFFRRFHQLAAAEDLSDLGPPLDGRRVMEELGLPPGPAVGQALDQLRQHRLANGPLTADQALALLRASHQVGQALSEEL